MGKQSYLHKIGKGLSLGGVFRVGVVDDAHHTVFTCGRSGGLHQHCYLTTGNLPSDNIVGDS